MTFNVFAFASNGWVMATDQAPMGRSGSPREAVRTKERTIKIEWDKSNAVASCCSGDEAALQIARAIVAASRTDALNKLDRSDIRGELRRIADEALAAEEARLGRSWMRDLPRDLVVVFGADSAWRIRATGTTAVRPLISSTCCSVYIGDTANAATFFSQRYYRDFLAKRTVKQLLTLLAHSVLEAHSLDPESVEGLNMLSYENGRGYEFFDDSKLGHLKTRSGEIFRLLESELFRE